MKIIFRTAVAATALVLASTSLLNAAPAPYYKWRSKATNEQICSQTPLGEGWEQADGPFKDPRCQKRVAVK